MTEVKSKPVAFVLFGASGDLAKIKLFPALYRLAEKKRLPKNFRLVGYARSPQTDDTFRSMVNSSVRAKFPKANQAILDKLIKQSSYIQGAYDQPEGYAKLNLHLESLFKQNTSHLTKIAYFSVPPVAFQPIIAGLAESCRHTTDDVRLVIEKPFGNDEHSATELFHFMASRFPDDHIYLLDHYLGKSAVQSILHLRHANRILNLMVKGPTIANIQITAFENVGIKDRVGYFDQVGTIKDMIQSHLMQVLALVTMSIPVTKTPESLHREKNSILSALTFPPSKRNVVVGQYQSYRENPDVPKGSNTETFAAVRLLLDRESWHNVPIYLRTGKKLNKKHTFIVIEIEKFAFQSEIEDPNRLILELQPDERISIQLVNKVGKAMQYETLTSSDPFICDSDECLPEHAELIQDVLQQNSMNFLSFQEIIAAWRLTDSIVGFLKRQHMEPEIYADGTSGPASHLTLPVKDGFAWYDWKKA